MIFGYKFFIWYTLWDLHTLVSVIDVGDIGVLEGAIVGDIEGVKYGIFVGEYDGDIIADIVGFNVGEYDGLFEGAPDGVYVAMYVGGYADVNVDAFVGLYTGAFVCVNVGGFVGVLSTVFHPSIMLTKLWIINQKTSTSPFQNHLVVIINLTYSQQIIQIMQDKKYVFTFLSVKIEFWQYIQCWIGFGVEQAAVRIWYL